MSIAFYIVAGLTLASAIAAMSLSNFVHAILCLMVFFAGVAGVFLTLNADFLAGAQMLLYVGAVGVLLIFAIMFTRNAVSELFRGSGGWLSGIVVATLVSSLIIAGVRDAYSTAVFPEVAQSSVKALGEALSGRHLGALVVTGVLLTAAMIGAVLVALPAGAVETAPEEDEA